MTSFACGPAIRLVITDLDNTVYDWIGSFVPAFYGMVDEAAEMLAVPKERLLDELQAIHRGHSNAEHPFALLETCSVQERLHDLAPEQRLERLSPAFARFSAIRKQLLRPYDGVVETLDLLHERGVPVVAYTDARVHNALYRIARLGLVPRFAALYAPRHPVEPVRFTPDPDYVKDIPAGFVRHLPPEDLKPNPHVLLDICREFATAPPATVYVGDSLSRDVVMARGAGVRSAWAGYGVNPDRDLWDKLVRITHWSADDVARDSRLRAQAAGVRADVTLARFSDILAAFEFSSGVSP